MRRDESLSTDLFVYVLDNDDIVTGAAELPEDDGLDRPW